MNRTPILFLNVLIIAACGLIYELLAGTVASYVLGDSVTQFSLIIGLYLSALGVGAWLSRFLDRDLAARFVDVELAVALAGGLSAPLLFLGFSRLEWFPIFLYGLVFVIGVLVGLELPILMRILKEHLDFKELVSRVLSFDYIGSLVAAVLFPMFLVPRLGLVRTSIVFGLLNAAVGLYGTWLLRPLLRGVVVLRARAVLVTLILLAALIRADLLTTLAEEELHVDDIVYSTSSQYQRILITRGTVGFQLFLNGNLQFTSADEYRYHEALVHPAMAAAPSPRRVVILGGGDGLALREVLKYPSVVQATLVDLDPKMTALSEAFPPLGALNAHAMRDPRVRVVNADAMIWLERTRETFDAAIVDFPDPSSFALGKLYTTRFYRLLRARLVPDATVAVQSTSPLFAPQSYWCIIRTMEAAGFHVRPYQATVPSFGVWGFALAQQRPFDAPGRVTVPVRFLDDATLAAMFVFPRDMTPVPVEINRLDNQILVRYYEEEWRKWS
ncbi:MAG TPA: polyamine aminopropyltransferase [Thermoanaerobaculia bacterium]|nr:polyamine aminopropyltransferase [Thermoanaerobaculia bacterium]